MSFVVSIFLGIAFPAFLKWLFICGCTLNAIYAEHEPPIVHLKSCLAYEIVSKITERTSRLHRVSHPSIDHNHLLYKCTTKRKMYFWIDCYCQRMAHHQRNAWILCLFFWRMVSNRITGFILSSNQVIFVFSIFTLKLSIATTTTFRISKGLNPLCFPNSRFMQFFTFENCEPVNNMHSIC